MKQEEIIRITETDGKRAVSARELHQFLESKQEFANWIKNRIEKYGFVEGQDFTSFDNFVKRETGSSVRKEYALTIDMAKELGIGQKQFINNLLRDGYLYRTSGLRRQLKPTAKYANDLFAIKDCKSGVNFWAGNQTMITPKGKETFRLLYGEKHNQLALF